MLCFSIFLYVRNIGAVNLDLTLGQLNHMKPCTIFFATLLLSFCATAQTQGKITKYFDKDWAVAVDRKLAAYYRTEEPAAKNLILVRDYFISGKLQMIAECSSTSPSLKFEGKCLRYYEDGTLQSEEYYEDNVSVGRHKFFYPGGQMRKEVRYRVAPLPALYVHYYSETGEDVLPNGNGTILLKSDGNVKQFEEIRDSVMYAMFDVNTVTNDTVYFATDKPAEYPGGLSALSRDIGAALVYPKSARRAGIQGTVFVSFIIDKVGNVTESNVIKHVSDDCDAAALTAVAALKRWIPGESRGKAAKTRFVLPIRFKFPGRR